MKPILDMNKKGRTLLPFYLLIIILFLVIILSKLSTDTKSMVQFFSTFCTVRMALSVAMQTIEWAQPQVSY